MATFSSYNFLVFFNILVVLQAEKSSDQRIFDFFCNSSSSRSFDISFKFSSMNVENLNVIEVHVIKLKLL